MKQKIAWMYFWIGHFFSKLMNFPMLGHSYFIYDWFMCKSFELDENKEIWKKLDE